MDTNTVVEPLDEPTTPDDVVVIVEPLDAHEPLDPAGAGDPVATETAVEAAGEAEAALLQRSLDWDRALATRDEALAREVLHPDFALEIVQPVRSVMRRDVWLEVLADYVVHEWQVEERVVDLTDDVAAVLQRVSMRATVMGEDRSGIVVVSDVWRCLDGRWVVWRRHSTPLMAGGLRADGGTDG